MSNNKTARFVTTLLVALMIASVGLLGGAAPALAKAKPKTYTFYVDSRGGVLYYHRTIGCTNELDGVHVKRVRATLARIKKAGYRPCPKCKPVGYKAPPKRFYGSKWSLYYSTNRRAPFIVAHRGGRLTLTWKQVTSRKLIPDPKTKPYGWVGFKPYYQAEPASFIADLVGEINRQRAELGNPPVSISATRCVASQSWADYLCRTRQSVHTSDLRFNPAPWQNTGVGWESVGYTHEPFLNLLTGEIDGGPTWMHVPAFVTNPDIAYIGAGVVYRRNSRGWDGWAASVTQADGDNLRGGRIEVSDALLSVSAGTTATATARITPDTAGDTFEWSLADSSIATLTVDGGVATIHPLCAGTTTIHVRTGVSQVDATATITVHD